MRFLSLIAALALIGTGCVSQKESGSKLLSEGKPANDKSSAPLTVPNNVVPMGDSGVSKVVAGLQHACAIRAGKLACWGLNKHGQIGNGDSGVTAGVNDPLTGANYLVKVAVNPYEVFSAGVSDVALGYEHTCAIKNDELFCWGSNEFGQIGGDVAATGITSRPTSVLTGAKQVSAHGRWTCAVTGTGQLVCFGTRLVKAANGTTAPIRLAATPKIMIPTGVQSVALSSNHGCVVLTSGALQCFGMNLMGEIGNGATETTDVGIPYEVFSSGVTGLSVTDSRTCAVVSGVIKCFGASLGDREIDRTAGAWKERTPAAYDAVFWSGVAPGIQASSSGTVISTSGDLLYGSFFHASGTAQTIALGVTQFSYSETDLVGCMMFRNHAVKCWGSNVFGQLGMGRRSAEDFTISQARDVAF